MSYALLVRPEAEADLAEARKWYEERLDGLGREFVEAVDTVLISLTQDPSLIPSSRK